MRPLVAFGAIFFILFAQFAAADWLNAPSVFEPIYYADRNKDVYAANGYDKAKLTAHWRRNGIKEGRISSPVFDVRYYLQNNKDVANAVGANNFRKAAQHWFTTGRQEGRPSHPKFHVKVYLEKNPELARTLGEKNYVQAIDHYLNVGYAKGLSAI